MSDGSQVFIALVAAAVFACPVPLHPDGASLRCANKDRVYQLEGIRVAPPLDSCRPWEFCTTDPGTASRDHLAELTRANTLECRSVGKDQVRCNVKGRDLSCAMVAAGQAVPRSDIGDCPPAPPPPTLLDYRPDIPWWAIAAALGFVNVAAFLTFAFDNYRSRRGFGGLPERLLLLLAMLGGGLGLLVGLVSVRDDAARRPSSLVFVILGLQIGAVAGILLL